MTPYRLLLLLLAASPILGRRLPRNCGLACNSVKKCLAVLDGSGGNRPGQLGNTGIIVLQTCTPKLEKAKKKGCTCQEEIDASNDTEEKASFHAATQTPKRTSHRDRTRKESTTSSRPSRLAQPSLRSPERATPSISRPEFRRPFRATRPTSVSVSTSVSSSVSTSTSSQRTPRRSLFSTDRRSLFASDRRRILAERLRKRH